MTPTKFFEIHQIALGKSLVPYFANHYCLIGQRSVGRYFLCSNFVEKYFKITSPVIRVEVSLGRFEGAKRVYLCLNGDKHYFNGAYDGILFWNTSPKHCDGYEFRDTYSALREWVAEHLNIPRNIWKTVWVRIVPVC